MVNPAALPGRSACAMQGARRGRNSVVECQLPKLDVAGSTPVARSLLRRDRARRWTPEAAQGLAACVAAKVFPLLPPAGASHRDGHVGNARRKTHLTVGRSRLRRAPSAAALAGVDRLYQRTRLSRRSKCVLVGRACAVVRAAAFAARPETVRTSGGRPSRNSKRPRSPDDTRSRPR